MKIAQVSSTFPPYEGGTGNVCYQQSKGLAALGHEVCVFLPENGSISKDFNKNLPFVIEYIHPFFTIGNASFVPRLKNKLKSFDIIHLHYPFFGGDFFVRDASRKYSIPYVLTYHQDVVGNTICRKGIFGTYNFLFQKSIMLNATKVLALSKDHIENSKVNFLSHIPDKIEIVPNGVNLEDFDSQFDSGNMREKYNINSGIPIIIFIGTLDRAHYFKKLEILLKAFQHLRTKSHLFVVGDGDLKNDYIKLAKSLHLNDTVTFTGKLTNRKAVQYIKQSDVLVLPSIDTESFGIVLIEAMACGKPVIASNLPGVRAIVDNNYNGLLFQKGNIEELTEKIEFLINNHEIAKSLGENGRNTVKNRYEWKIITKKLEQVYAECI